MPGTWQLIQFYRNYISPFMSLEPMTKFPEFLFVIIIIVVIVIIIGKGVLVC